MAYITVSDVRAAGLTQAKVADADVTSAIALWQEFLDRACRQWFEPRTLAIKFDGTDSDTLHFGVPIISVTSLKVNDSPTALPVGSYRVYSSAGYPDDRRNPRIKLVSEGGHDIYSAPMQFGRFKFQKGRQNQEIVGSFGFVEADGTTPLMIKRALLKLVLEKLQTPVYVDPTCAASGISSLPPMLAGALKEEWTDGHRLVYAVSDPAPRKPGLTGVTQDQEIHDIIRLYRAPIGIATPANPSY